MHRVFKWFCLTLSLALSGCIPFYLPKDTSQTAQINLTEVENPSFKIGNKKYRLVTDRTGYAMIPYGQPITLISHHSSQQGGYPFILLESCQSQYSFIPEAHQRYYANFLINGTQCKLTVYKASSGKKFGLTIVPSLNPLTYDNLSTSILLSNIK